LRNCAGGIAQKADAAELGAEAAAAGGVQRKLSVRTAVDNQPSLFEDHMERHFGLIQEIVM
jgi:hypothetical protein